MDLQQIIEELERLRTSIEEHLLLALRGVDPDEQIGAVSRDLERIKQFTRELEELEQ